LSRRSLALGACPHFDDPAAGMVTSIHLAGFASVPQFQLDSPTRGSVENVSLPMILSRPALPVARLFLGGMICRR
jgi:hypothetical protein